MNADARTDHADAPTISEALLAVLPVTAFGLAWISLSLPNTGLSENWLAVMIIASTVLACVVSLIGMAVGWLRGFPRWSLPYFGAAFFFALYWSNVTTPGLRPFGIEMFGRELWGWRAWVPFALVSAAACYRAYPRVDWRAVQQRFKNDWTLVLFAVYGTSHMLVGFMFDEIKSVFLFPATVLGISMLAVGGVSYMLAKSVWVRIFALGASAYLTILFAGLFSAMYWDGRQEYWMKAPANGMEEFIWTVWFGVVLLFAVACISWLVAKLVASFRLEPTTVASS